MSCYHYGDGGSSRPTCYCLRYCCYYCDCCIFGVDIIIAVIVIAIIFIIVIVLACSDYILYRLISLQQKFDFITKLSNANIIIRKDYEKYVVICR